MSRVKDQRELREETIRISRGVIRSTVRDRPKY